MLANIAKHAVDHLQRMFFGLSSDDLCKLAFDLADKNHLHHPLKNNRAGKFWLQSFLKRHPELSLRCPEPTGLARAVGFNKPVVKVFFVI